MTRPRFPGAGVLFVSCLAACGPVSSGGAGDAGVPPDGFDPAIGLQSIDVTPPSQTLDLTPPSTVTAGYHAIGHYAGGKTLDITSYALWSLDDASLGTISAGVFTSYAHGGQTMVRATVGTIGGVASLTVLAQVSRVEPPAPSTAPSQFMGATMTDPALAGRIVYPYDQVLLPQNLGQLEVQWQPGSAGGSLFEVSIQSATTDVKVYTATSKYTLEPDVWNLVAQSNHDGAAALTVSAMSSSRPGYQGTSPAVSLRFANSSVQGALYYWSTGTGTGCGSPTEGIYRFDFAASSTSAAAFYTNSSAGGHCVGCHSLSRDGALMSFRFDGGTAANIPGGLLDVKTVTPIIPWSANAYWHFSTFFPDGKNLVTSHMGTLSVRTATAAGTALGSVPLPPGAIGVAHPDVSPDAAHIAYTYTPGGGCATFGPNDAFSTGDGIAITPVTEPATFGTPSVLVAPDPACRVNHYYPAFSPDGSWLLFDESTYDGVSAGSDDTYADPTASLYLVPSKPGTGSPIQLAAIDAIGPSNSWPRWSPFSGTYQGKAIYWITFSSKRDYGVELVGLQRAQIWMAAVAPGMTLSGSSDPSAPPFWLPLQDMTTANHTGAWTTKAIN